MSERSYFNIVQDYTINNYNYVTLIYIDYMIEYYSKHMSGILIARVPCTLQFKEWLFSSNSFLRHTVTV